jgi:predicted dehydrogenase
MVLVFCFTFARTQPVCAADPVRLITLDPGHFHAALLQKDPLPDVEPRVHVYAPLGPDLLAHLSRIARFNSRSDHPTRWQLEVHAGPDFLDRMLQERPGNVVVISGRNQAKIDYIEAAANAGLHVLADKPWIIEARDLPRLEASLQAAARHKVAAFDAMTQRFEVSCLVQRALVSTPEVFGAPLPGSLQDPAVHMESTHYLLKEVAGVASLRPAWFFDVRQQGEGLTDVGTHLVDQVQTILFPDQAIDYRRDIAMIQASRAPTVLSLQQFQRVTGESAFPQRLRGDLKAGQLHYMANNTVQYTIRGLHVRLDIRWEFEAPAGAKDAHRAVFRGDRSRVEIRQGLPESFVPEVCVVPNESRLAAPVGAALQRRVDDLQGAFPGLSIREEAGQFRVVIPARLRVGHEDHFSLLVGRFLQYVRDPSLLPAWEKTNMLAKYFVTTRGVEIARGSTP